MSGDFTETQRGIIQRIANDVVSDAVARPPTAEGAPKVPDLNLAREIARSEIKTWEKSKPRWWDIRRNLGTQLAGGGFAAFLVLFLVDWIWESKNLAYDAAHALMGTESRIESKVAGMFSQWEKRSDTDGAKVIDAAFKSNLARWTEEKDFQATSGRVLEAMAQRDVPAFKGLVTRVLNSQPILMFQAQSRLGSTSPVQVSDKGCELLASHWYEKRPEMLPDFMRPNPETKTLEGAAYVEEMFEELARLSEACEVSASVTRDTSVNIPFWARIHPDNSKTKDRVYLLTFVKRSLNQNLTSQFAIETTPARSEQGHQTHTEASPRHPYPNSLNGLIIEYHSSKQADSSLSIDVSTFNDQKGGFWHKQIDGFLNDNLKAPDPSLMQVQDLLHGITISLPKPPADSGDDFCEKQENLPSAKAPHAACLDEIVEITAIVMVNKVR